MKNNVVDIMSAHSMEVGVQTILDIPGTIYLLSVVPEYSYKYRSADGRIHVSREPQSMWLNCAVMEPSTEDDGIAYSPVYYREFNCEEDFYDFMIAMSKNCDCVTGEW
jgi:hypothetical protein